MIKTERLELRKFAQQDRNGVMKLLGNADFMAFSPTGAMTPEQVDVRFEELVSAFQNKGIGNFVLWNLGIGLRFELEVKDMHLKQALQFSFLPVKLMILKFLL